MRSRILIFFLLWFPLQALALDSVSVHRPAYWGFQVDGGRVLKTNSFVRGDYEIPHYYSLSAEYGKSAYRNSWKDVAYGLSFYGVGIYCADFFRDDDLGSPIALYLTQGATLFKFSSNLLLNYKWNLGVSANWVPYNPFTNPQNFAIGSFLNVYFSGNLQLHYGLTKNLGLVCGLGLSHFSNGASQMPNYGLNTLSTQVQLIYSLNKGGLSSPTGALMEIPKFTPHLEHEFLVVWSKKKTEVDTSGTNFPSPYVDKDFRVFGLSYSLIVDPNYRYKYGLGIDFLYDESANVTVERIKSPSTGKYHDVFDMGLIRERLSLGLSLRGEIELPRHSVFANLGYNLIPSASKESRLYQVIGVKVHITNDLFGTFGIRATQFSRASFLYWSVGYIIPGRNLSKK